MDENRRHSDHDSLVMNVKLKSRRGFNYRRERVPERTNGGNERV